MSIPTLDPKEAMLNMAKKAPTPDEVKARLGEILTAIKEGGEINPLYAVDTIVEHVGCSRSSVYNWWNGPQAPLRGLCLPVWKALDVLEKKYL